MAYNPEVGKKMDAAQKEAERELLQAVDNMTPEEAQGAKYIAKWIKQNYMSAGYKRLSRTLMKELA